MRWMPMPQRNPGKKASDTLPPRAQVAGPPHGTFPVTESPLQVIWQKVKAL